MASTNLATRRRRSRQKASTVERLDRTGLGVDRIVRVSRVGNRDVASTSYQTETEQIETINHVLAAKNLPLGELFISRDESGHDWTDKRDNLAVAMERVRNGESAGIAVSYFSRFARTASEGIAAIEELNQRGAIFISAKEGLDSTTEMGRFALSMMALFSQMEWNRFAENWRSSVARAIGEGRYVSGALPTGYLRGDDGRLVPDPAVAPIIQELFRLRAEEGWSWGKLAEWLTAEGVRPHTASMTTRSRAGRPSRAERYGPDGWKRWTTSSIVGIVSNPVYLGYAFQLRADDELVNETAHTPIVEEWLWQKAQTATSSALAGGGRTGEMSDRCLAKGLCRCETCGHVLLITGRFDKKAGQRMPLYYCKSHFASGDCAARANIDAAKLDRYIERLILEHIAPGAAATRVTSGDKKKLSKFRGVAEKAEADLQSWLQTLGLQDDVGGAAPYRAELRRRREVRDGAVAEFDAEDRRQRSAANIESGSVLEHWPTMTTIERREIVLDLADRIVVKPAHGRKGRGAPPVEERVVVVWKNSLT